MALSANQKAFNKAYRGLKSQGFLLSIVAGECAYRGHDGMRCALGWLIPDKKYSPEFEGKGYWRLPDDALVPADATLFGALQDAHDNSWSGPQGMQKRLAEVAERFSLTIPA